MAAPNETRKVNAKTLMQTLLIMAVLPSEAFRPSLLPQIPITTRVPRVPRARPGAPPAGLNR
jgi:hypothetical protein